MKKLVIILLALVLCLSVFVACNKNEEGLAEALKVLDSLYKDKAEATPADYDVVAQVKVGEDLYTVTWSTNVEGVTVKASSKQGFSTIDIVNEKSPEDLPYVLTATIADAKGNTVTATYNRKFPAYKALSYAEYAAAEDESTVVVMGIVTGIFSASNGSTANGMYLQDLKGEGGYYVYGFADTEKNDPIADMGIKVGMTVEVAGEKDTYNGLYEVVKATATIVDSTIKTVTPVDYTDIFKNAETLKDVELVGKQSMLVTIKGVEIGAQGDNGYHYFKLNGKETYVRLSSSNNCITKDEKTAFSTAHGEHFSWLADVTGIIQLYNDNFYLIPATVDAFEYKSEIPKTPAEKVEIEKGNLSLADSITSNTEITLPAAGTNYADVTIAWTVVEGEAAAIVDGKLVITLQAAASTAKVKATLTCGEATGTVEFTIAVSAIPTTKPVPVETPVAGTPYKIMLIHPNKDNKAFYITGLAGNREYYWATTQDANAAADIYAEAVEGGFQLYWMNGEAKVYLNIRANGDYVNCLYEAAPACVYTYDATINAMVTVVNEKTYTFGIKSTSTYDTLEAKVVGEGTVTAQLVAMVEEVAPQPISPNPIPNGATSIVVNTPYYIGALNKNGNLFFKGVLTSGRIDSALTTAEAVTVMLEAGDSAGEYYIYFMNGDVKTYIAAVKNESTGFSFETTKTANGVWVIDAVKQTIISKAFPTRGMGTQVTKEYTTISTYATSNFEKTDYSVCWFVPVDGGSTPDVPPAPPAHEHAPATEWSKDETNHWHACTDATCTEKLDSAKHNFAYGNCVCGQAKPVSPNAIPGGLTEIAVDTPYHLAGLNQNGSIYMINTVTKGRVDGTVSLADAAIVKLEAGAAAGEYYIYFTIEGVKNYLTVTGSGTSKFALSTEKDEGAVWIIDTAAKTIISKQYTDRAIGSQVTGTYTNYSFYSTQNLGNAEYAWTWFVASHTHTWSAEWTSNTTAHWHACTAAGCPITAPAEMDGYAEHVYDDATALCACGKSRPHDHTWATGWSCNETHHWHVCTLAGCNLTDADISEMNGYGEHVLDANNQCDCGHIVEKDDTTEDTFG